MEAKTDYKLLILRNGYFISPIDLRRAFEDGKVEAKQGEVLRMVTHGLTLDTYDTERKPLRESSFGAIREATIIDKAIDKHYIVITTVYGKQYSIEFANAERERAIKIVHSLNGHEE